MKKQGFFGLFLMVVLIVGEVQCVVKFFTSDFEPSYRRECIYGIGALTGFGSIIGYFNIEDDKGK